MDNFLYIQLAKEPGNWVLHSQWSRSGLSEYSKFMIFTAFVPACIKQCEGYGLDPRNSKHPNSLNWLYYLYIYIYIYIFFYQVSNSTWSMRWGSQKHSCNLELRMMELKVASSVYIKWGCISSELCSSLPEVFIMRIREQSEHMITNELQNTACQVEESRKEAVWRSDCFSGTLPAVSVISYFYTGILVLTAWVKVSGSCHAERITSGCTEKRETLILLFSYLYLLCLIVKTAAEVLWNMSFINEIFKIAVKYREAWTESPYSGKVSCSTPWVLPCSEGMAECARKAS